METISLGKLEWEKILDEDDIVITNDIEGFLDIRKNICGDSIYIVYDNISGKIYTNAFVNTNAFI